MKGFSDREREVIRQGLLDAGREQFAQHGPQKTTISELTNAVGIGTSTFYTFFDSKEDLYVEVMMRERARLVERVEESLGDTSNTKQALHEFLEFLFDELETNPLLRTLFLDETGRELYSAFIDGAMDSQYEEGLELIGELIHEHQRKGSLRNGDPEVIMHALKSVALVAVHRDTVPDRMFDKIREVLISMAVNGLIETEDQLT